MVILLKKLLKTLSMAQTSFLKKQKETFGTSVYAFLDQNLRTLAKMSRLYQKCPDLGKKMSGQWQKGSEIWKIKYGNCGHFTKEKIR